MELTHPSGDGDGDGAVVFRWPLISAVEALLVLTIWQPTHHLAANEMR